MTQYILTGETPSYPFDPPALRWMHPGTSFSDVIGDDTLAEYGVFPVSEISSPSTSPEQIVDEATPWLDGSVWRQAWVVRDRTPDELAAARSARKADGKAARDVVLQAGWTHTFSVGTHTLDLRDADDKANWTLLLLKAQGMIALGAGASPVQIRTSANVSIEIPATEAFAAMNAFLAWGAAVLARKWALDEEIADAANFAALAAIDIEADWP